MLFENRSIEREREREVFETESRKDLRAMTNAMKTEEKKKWDEKRGLTKRAFDAAQARFDGLL